jgi:hypothetical protein
MFNLEQVIRGALDVFRDFVAVTRAMQECS